MNVILGIETATDVCAAAVDVDGAIVCSASLDRPRKHAERLVPMMDDVLQVAGLTPGQIDAVAVSAGPGSYTGLRIGVSTAKGLALATGARFVAVSSLQAMALAAAADPGSAVLAAFTARRAEVYIASFVIGPDGIPVAGIGPLAGSPAELLRELSLDPSRSVTIVGDGGRIVAETLSREGIAFLRDPLARPSAAAVARLGRTANPVDLERFEPYYLREFTARPASGSVFDRLPF